MVTITKILVPVDFFPASDAAVNYAAGIAANYDASVHLLHVITPIAAGTYEYAIDTTELLKSMEETTMEEMNKLVARVKQAGAVAKAEVRVGDVYDEIKRAIELMKPELVVMGTHGWSGVVRWMLGSTARYVIQTAPCPVLTVAPASVSGQAQRQSPGDG